MSVLRSGSKGDDVKAMQTTLNKLGFSLAADGTWTYALSRTFVSLSADTRIAVPEDPRPAEGEPEADLLRRLVRQSGGGHATLMRGSPAARAAVPVFEPQPAPIAALSARLKAEFDPKNILNPGRLAAGVDSATLAPETEENAS